MEVSADRKRVTGVTPDDSIIGDFYSYLREERNFTHDEAMNFLGKVPRLAESTITPAYRQFLGLEHDFNNTLRQQVILQEGEDLEDVARELVGPKGTATYELQGQMPGDQYPTILFYGSTRALAAIEAKAAGSRIGRPPKAEK